MLLDVSQGFPVIVWMHRQGVELAHLGDVLLPLAAVLLDLRQLGVVPGFLLDGFKGGALLRARPLPELLGVAGYRAPASGWRP